VSATCLRQLLAAAAADGISTDRISAFVADATDPDLADRLASDPGDVALIMFTLSAVPPGQSGMLSMLRNAAAALKPGGRLCIRDHGLGDMVQLRIPPEQVVFSEQQQQQQQASRAGGGTTPAGEDAGSSGGAETGDIGGSSLAFGGREFYYRRGDGTLAYFYRADELAAMGAAAGLAPARAEYACVVNPNRRSGQSLRRVFVQAEFLRA
jgi:hypothetical protein